MSGDIPLGGFFGLELPDADAGLWRLWGAGRGRAYVNATSALAALIAMEQPGQVWFPAFLCPEFPAAAPRPRYYALTEDLAPDTATLDPEPGDMVIGVNYFGRTPGDAWARYVAAHSGVIFVEDCAQTILTGVPAWGHWRLYSPRKVAGVPDGGLLIPTTDAPLPPAPAPAPAEATQAALAAKLARMEAPRDNALWHPMNQAHEAAHGLRDQAMSTLSRRLLGLLDADRIATRRHENFRVLAQALPDLAVLDARDPDFVPFGFPIRLPADQRNRVAQALYAQRIFPAVHWRSLPAPRAFSRDWARAETYLTLPCDQRWTRQDMTRLARAVRAAI